MNEEIILKKFAERFYNLIKEEDTDIAKLAEKIGIKSKSTIYRYMNGEMSPKISTVKYIAEYFNINPTWLMGYDVPMKDNINTNLDVISAIEIPILGKISAGLPLFAEEHLEGKAYAPANLIKPGYEYFYLKVKGDSMNLKFNEGDIVLVQKQETLENGQIGVIRVNGYDATIKKYRLENGLIILEPMSTNTEHRTQIYNPQEIEIAIIGKAISYQGNL